MILPHPEKGTNLLSEKSENCLLGIQSKGLFFHWIEIRMRSFAKHRNNIVSLPLIAEPHRIRPTGGYKWFRSNAVFWHWPMTNFD